MEGRQRLRPWLEAKIDSGTIHGLAWLNDEKTMFKIPWKHGGKQDWTPDNSRVFMEWAKHTGRFREGIDDADYATWKTRLRCAFNKAPDIQEVKDKTNLDAPEPYRVYKLLPRKDSNMKGSPGVADADFDQTPPHMVDEDMPSMPSTGPDIDILGNEQHILANISDNINSASLPSDLKSVESLNLIEKISMSAVTRPQDAPMDCEDKMEICGLLMDSCDAAWRNYEGRLGHEMHLTLFYRKSMIYDELITNPRGSRLYYGTLPTDNSLPEELVQKIYGPDHLQQIELPPPDKFMHTDKQKTVTNQLLDCMNRGLIITCKDGDIEATRLCKCAVFYSSTQTQGESRKLQRDQTQKIFSYDLFVQQQQAYETHGMSVPPSVEVCLAFGQSWQFTEGQDNVLISGKVISMKAKNPNFAQISSEQQSEPLMISESNEYDQLNDIVKASAHVSEN